MQTQEVLDRTTEDFSVPPIDHQATPAEDPPWSGSYWNDKVVIVTGGSSGLGLAIGEAFAEKGAKTVLAARTPGPLRQAADSLRDKRYRVLDIAADVTSQESVDHLIKATLDEFGQIDVLVNNAGRSMRRSILKTSPEDFAELMDLNFLGVVRCTLAAAPHLIKRKGHLVNIGSLAGKAPARHVGAYPATKFATSAYTQQLRLELEPLGLHVMLVCPGPIARSAPRREPEQQLRGEFEPGLPDRAYLPGAGVRTRSYRPERIAQAIVRGCQNRKREILFPWSSRFLFALMQVSPTLADFLIRRFT